MKNIFNLHLVLLFFLTSILYPPGSYSQTAPPFEWATNCLAYYNGSISYANYGTGICTDEHANNYTTGWFNGTIYFDTCTLSAVGQENYFMVSYDSSGNFRWAKQFTGNGSAMATDIVYDQAGHIYTAGEFDDSISFNGFNYFTIGQRTGYYIARFDTAGNFQYAKIFQPLATYGWVSNIRLSADNMHNIYAVGGYQDSLKIDGILTNFPATDNFYFIKFDSNGSMQILKSGYSSNANNLQITQDLQSHIYITGSVTDTIRIQSVTMTGRGLFIAGFNETGNYKWMNISPGTTVTGAQIKTVDNLLYVGGWYNDSLHIGTTTFYTPTITHNTFLAQFDTAGAFYWAKRMDVVQGNQIRINSMVASGNYIYVAGEFTKSLIFNGVQYTSTTPINTARDPYVAAYSNYGNELWFKGAGSFHDDYGFDLDIDNEENLYLTGSTHFPSYFDNIVLIDTGGIGGNNPVNTFIAKIGNSNVVSVPGTSSSTQVSIYPNPLITQSKIIFSNPGNNKFTFTLSDITGRTVEANSTENSEIILFKGTKPAGVYLFNLVNEKTNECMSGKILVCD